jgi:membrane dipeptidase
MSFRDPKASQLSNRAAPMGTATATWSNIQYDKAFVIDGMAGWTDADRPLPPGRLPAPLYQAIVESGATAFHLTVGGLGPERFDIAVKEIGLYDQIIQANSDVLIKANSADDIRRAKAQRKAALVYGFQDSGMIGANLERIDVFAALGVRVMQPTYNIRTLWADGALEEANGGLSRLGREAIKRIETARVLLDMSHGGHRTIAEALELAERPSIISHTGCRALFDHPRNIDDDAMRLLANKGGVVGIYWTPFLHSQGDATPEAVLRHMAHAVNVCGEDHVSVGTDGELTRRVFTPEEMAKDQREHEIRVRLGIAAPGERVGLLVTVPEWNSPNRFRLLAEALDTAGWPASRIEKVLGANLLRLFEDVWSE